VPPEPLDPERVARGRLRLDVLDRAGDGQLLARQASLAAAREPLVRVDEAVGLVAAAVAGRDTDDVGDLRGSPRAGELDLTARELP
jgi:hypothetical protein